VLSFFSDLHKILDEMQKKKLDEINKLFSEANYMDVKKKASDLNNRAEKYQSFLNKMK